ncbi:amino acid permease [Liquorilactobacillus satsumensis]|uniref:APC family amino acid transporter n=1 Tax=Liquorilactobacillus satsumensis DSM 16230 = JCM 12392 TaxID=1423801 RepID=A0A0R1V4V1_9LACO|nr:amino acid permease [Liquorilactobacillus satsumensis]KRM00545.1 APC family amino acid transporter [Liquorilactobacillus satsumensis DSM 16230 = JCM 12392]MCC7667402.1 amino acid permease [Liquorilactobacillus satsumensis]MCP9313261.1 amino acid permease [Liquorilactobacillus satsumensis]MCP9329513.1 amino acid permease [Liquorilactobacillus satsumensis]MCP9358618.1 amino acid permease [Liquorilactobacillus satsumensis]
MKKEHQFSRSLKSRHVQLIALGGTIGTGLFLGAGKTIHLAGPSIIFAYLITGIICFLLMRSLGELLLSDLNSHSFIDFIAKYLGEEMGFVTGWTYWICWVTIAMADVTASGLYIKYWFPNVPQWLPGFIILVVLLTMNLITVGLFGEAEFWFALIKVVAIVVLIVTGIVLVLVRFKTPTGHASLENLFSFGGLFPTGARGFFSSFQMVTFGFIGIELIGVTASETENPKQVIPKAINEIPVRVILFYVGSLVALMCIYPWDKIVEDQSPFVQVFQGIGVTAAAGIINFVVLTAAASACNSSLFSTGRMIFSLNYKKNGKFASKMSKLSHRQVPANGLIFSAIAIGIAVLANFVFSNTALFTFISSVATTCFLFIWGMIVLAHLRYRKIDFEKSGQQFKAPLYPWSDYVVLAFLVLVAGSMLLDSTSIWALAVAVVWLLVLWLGKHFKFNI